MDLHPNGPDARGLLYEIAQFYLTTWRKLCLELTQDERDGKSTAFLEPNVCEARNEFAALIASDGPFVLFIAQNIVTVDRQVMPRGYYKCEVPDAQPQLRPAGDPDRGEAYKKPRTIRIWLVLHQPGNKPGKVEKVNVELELKYDELMEIYFAV